MLRPITWIDTGVGMYACWALTHTPAVSIKSGDRGFSTAGWWRREAKIADKVYKVYHDEYGQPCVDALLRFTPDSLTLPEAYNQQRSRQREQHAGGKISKIDQEMDANEDPENMQEA